MEHSVKVMRLFHYFCLLSFLFSISSSEKIEVSVNETGSSRQSRLFWCTTGKGKPECISACHGHKCSETCSVDGKFFSCSYKCGDIGSKCVSDGGGNGESEETTQANIPNVAPPVGLWAVTYNTGENDEIIVESSGKVTSSVSGRSSFLEPSDNQRDFPSKDGWLMIKNLLRPDAWEYYRPMADGTVQIQQFCSDGCSNKYGMFGTPQYCCSGVGTDTPNCKPGEVASEVCKCLSVRSSRGTMCEKDDTCEQGICKPKCTDGQVTSETCKCGSTTCLDGETCDSGTCASACPEGKEVEESCMCGSETCAKEQTCESEKCVSKCEDKEVAKEACKCGSNNCERDETCDKGTCIPGCKEGEEVTNSDGCMCGSQTCSKDDTCESETCLMKCTEKSIASEDCKCGSATCKKEQDTCDGGTCTPKCTVGEVVTETCTCGDNTCTKDETCDGDKCVPKCEDNVVTQEDCSCGGNAVTCSKDDTCDDGASTCWPKCDENTLLSVTCKCNGNTCVKNDQCIGGECIGECAGGLTNEKCICDQVTCQAQQTCDLHGSGSCS